MMTREFELLCNNTIPSNDKNLNKIKNTKENNKYIIKYKNTTNNNNNNNNRKINININNNEIKNLESVINMLKELNI